MKRVAADELGATRELLDRAQIGPRYTVRLIRQRRFDIGGRGELVAPVIPAESLRLIRGGGS